MTLHYFAEDGNYGSAEGLIVVDSSTFTEEEWEEIDSLPDNDRILFVQEVINDSEPIRNLRNLYTSEDK
jgi:hypothetical protein